MASFDHLKQALKEILTEDTLSLNQPLSDTQYNAGFDILMHGSEWTSYSDFIIPQLSQLLSQILKSRSSISVLEIGPGSKTVLSYVPIHLRRKIRRYAALEPNALSAASLEQSLFPHLKADYLFPCLENAPDIYQTSFSLDRNPIDDGGKFDIIIFCHSMYGMKPRHSYVRRALELLIEEPEGGVVVIFHRDDNFELDGLTCDRTANFPTGTFSVPNDDATLDTFVPFVTGLVKQDGKLDGEVRSKCHKICRDLACHDQGGPDRLVFTSPQRMVTFTQHATALPELEEQVPCAKKDRTFKSWEARLHQPASIIKPTTIKHVQQCINWALKHKVGLAVIGGGHSANCARPNVVSVDMEAFDQVHIINTDKVRFSPSSDFSVVAEAGCKAGGIIQKALESGLTVPLGSRPSVGAGLWLQGGIGHLTRSHGLACDAIIGAVIVSVESGQLLLIGEVPSQHVPVGAKRPKNEKDLLWAIRGAGTNFGIVISVTFKTYPAPTYSVRKWVFRMSNKTQKRDRLGDLKSIAKDLPRNCSVDGYLYWENGQLHLGVTMFESSTSRVAFKVPAAVVSRLGSEGEHEMVDSVGLFESEMYMSGMHGGHGGGKTTSFKRCIFLKDIAVMQVTDILISAIENRPSQLCYLHLLQGGGAVGNKAADATAFGCRNWDFACVITGVWPRDQDGTKIARTTVEWVYSVARDLLPFCDGVYGADLGPDPRDNVLAMKAFGPNLPRLARLKQFSDPFNVIAYNCPLPKPPVEQKLIILVTGDSAAGKDYCANIWVSTITTCTHGILSARSVSISDATKREYATNFGADLDRLLSDRSYKEKHRSKLTKFYQDQLCKRPQLPMDHFSSVVENAGDVDVLFITGMRDEAPVATFSHLVPDSRLLDLRVQASQSMRQTRKGHLDGDKNNEKDKDTTSNSASNSTTLHYIPSLIFNNDRPGNEAAEAFATSHLLPFLHEDLKRLANMVRAEPDFPSKGIVFRHVLDICQQPGGLTLCTNLLQRHFSGDWAKIDALVCCEAGGFLFASPLGMRLEIPLALVRKSGKLPQPIISVATSPSHISSKELNETNATRVEMNRDSVRNGGLVVIVDDVFATGKTLCAVLELLVELGVPARNISIMVVAELPIHNGREMLRKKGFGEVSIQSLLVFGGV